MICRFKEGFKNESKFSSEVKQYEDLRELLDQKDINRYYKSSWKPVV